MNKAILNDTDVDDILERATFSSGTKRAPFSSWSGKRAPFSSWSGKRASFSSWAGKRSSLANIYDTRGGKGTTYQVWLKKGSNDYDVYPDQLSISGARKRAQHLHHAKSVMPVNPELSVDEGRADSAGKGKIFAFSTWAGNREFWPKIKDLVTRKAFNVWASKRAPFSVWSGKRSEEVNTGHWFGKQSEEVNTGHWFGKQRQDEYSSQHDDYSLPLGVSGQYQDEEQKNDRSEKDENRSRKDENRWGRYKRRSIQDGKRAAFSAWAGKRSLEHGRTTFAARPDKLSVSTWQSSKGDGSVPLHRAHKQLPLSDQQQQLGVVSESKERQRREELSESKERQRREELRRSYHLLHKRAASNARDKRAAINSREVHKWSSNHNRWSGKRAPFNAWGGKRSTGFLYPQDDHLEAKELFQTVDLSRRSPFSAWGGKRSFSAVRPERRAGFHAWAGKRGGQRDSHAVLTYDHHAKAENAYSNPTSGDDGGAEEGYIGPTAYSQGGVDGDLHEASSQDRHQTLPLASPFLNNMDAADHPFSSLFNQIFPVPSHPYEKKTPFGNYQYVNLPYEDLAKSSPRVLKVGTAQLAFISSNARNEDSHSGLSAPTRVGFPTDISGLPAEVPDHSQYDDQRDLDRSWPLLTHLELTPDTAPIKRRFHSWAGRR